MSYAGDVSPQEAWDRLSADPASVLVDVRTRPELAFVGTPDLSALGKQLITIQWTVFPTGEVNAHFLDQLAEAGVDTDTTVYFICRSGQRSQGSATLATAAGFTAYNVAEGFEGDLDADGHRGVGGWKSAGLPWRQS